MKNLSIAICLLSAASLGLQARTLTPQEALERVTNSQATSVMKKSASQIKSSLLVHEIATAGTPDMYVFATQGNEGYMIVGADDVAAPVIAYVDNGTFDYAQLPDNMKWWLSEYAKEIEGARKYSSALKVGLLDKTSTEKSPIVPIVTTKWNQGSPYNDNCPLLNGTRTYTGCVATAMAQVMKYHNWPVQGTGSYSYTWNGNTLSQDFSSQTYRWSDMTDTYDSSSSDAAKSAVAELMYACGVSVNMSYSTSGSGTQSTYVETALLNYFDYSKSSTTLVDRDLFDISTWQDLVYETIKNYGPVYYSGTNNTAGHAFVVDGYSSNDYFHLNWGWGGVSDGYFRLTALDPSSQGIGGSSAGYNLSQSALIGCAPSTSTNTFTTIICATTDLEATYDADSRKMTITGNFQNQMNESRKVNLGVRITSESDGNVQYVGATTNRNFGSKRYATNYSVTLPELADGVYTLKPVYNPNITGDAQWFDVNCGNGRTKFVITVANGAVTIKGAEESYNIYVDNISLASPVYANCRFALKGTLVNPTDEEYYGPLYALFLNSGGSVTGICTSIPVLMAANETREMDYVGYVYNGSVDLGEGYVGFAVLNGNYLYAASDFIEVNVKEKPVSTIITSPSWSIKDSSAVNANSITANGILKCTTGFFAGSLSVYIADNTGNWVTYFPSEYIFVEEGNQTEFSVTGSLPNAQVGDVYTACLYGNSAWVSDEYLQFTIGTSGVEDVALDSEDFSIKPNATYDAVRIDGLSGISSVAVYSFDAMRQPVGVAVGETGAVVDMSGLNVGVYLIRVNAQGKSYTAKMIKK